MSGKLAYRDIPEYPVDLRCGGTMVRLLLLAFLSMLAFEGVVFAESGPVFSDTGPEAEAYGSSKGYPVPPFEYPPGFRQDFMVGMYSHYDKVHPMRTVPKPAMPLDFKARGRGNRTSLSLRRAAEGDWRLSRYAPRDRPANRAR